MLEFAGGNRMLTWRHMKDLGFREGLSGTKYIRDAVNYILSQPDTYDPVLTRDVYVVVGGRYGKTWVQVERCIRHAIERCESAAFSGKTKDVIMELVQRCREGEFTA